MRLLASNPLLLLLIAFVVDAGIDVTLPATRGGLYDQAVDKLLTLDRGVEVRYPSEPPTADQKRAILEHGARRLRRSARRVDLRRQDANKGAVPGCRPPGGAQQRPMDQRAAEGPDPQQRPAARRGRQGLLLPALTIQEFLAASALARMVNSGTPRRWRKHAGRVSRRWTVRQLVDRKAWDPAGARSSA